MDKSISESKGKRRGRDGSSKVVMSVKFHWRIQSHKWAAQSDTSRQQSTTSLWHQVASRSLRACSHPEIPCIYGGTKHRACEEESLL